MRTDVSPARIVVAGSLPRERALALQRAADALLLLARPSAPSCSTSSCSSTWRPGGRSSRWPPGPRLGEWSRRPAGPWCPPTTWRRSWRRCGASPRRPRGARARRNQRLLLPGRRRAHGRGGAGRRGVSQRPPPALGRTDGRVAFAHAAQFGHRLGDLSLRRWRPARRRSLRPASQTASPPWKARPATRPRRSTRTCTATSRPWSAPTTSAGSPTRGSRSKRLYDADDVAAGARGAAGRARRVPLHARHPPGHVPRPAVDDAPVRRLRDRPRRRTSATAT